MVLYFKVSDPKYKRKKITMQLNNRKAIAVILDHTSVNFDSIIHLQAILSQYFAGQIKTLALVRGYKY